jgi:hypothetical protein
MDGLPVSAMPRLLVASIGGLTFRLFASPSGWKNGYT